MRSVASLRKITGIATQKAPVSSKNDGDLQANVRAFSEIVKHDVHNI